MLLGDKLSGKEGQRRALEIRENRNLLAAFQRNNVMFNRGHPEFL